jgi:hypothetical protein
MGKLDNDGLFNVTALVLMDSDFQQVYRNLINLLSGQIIPRINNAPHETLVITKHTLIIFQVLLSLQGP